MEDKNLKVLIDCANKELHFLDNGNVDVNVSCLSQIVRLAAEGDEQALIYLMPIIQRYIIRWSYQYGNLIYSNLDINDIIQETILLLLKLFSKNNAFKSSSDKSFYSFLNYARRTNKTVLLTSLRKIKQAQREVDIDENSILQSNDPIGSINIRLIINNIINELLDEQEKEIFMHRFVIGRNPEEIANELNIDKKSIINIIVRITRKLRKSQELQDLVGTRENDLNRFWAENIVKIDGSS